MYGPHLVTACVGQEDSPLTSLQLYDTLYGYFIVELLERVQRAATDGRNLQAAGVGRAGTNPHLCQLSVLVGEAGRQRGALLLYLGWYWPSVGVPGT